MNATTFDTAPARVTPVHPTHSFRMLLRREYWEHKGGFLWAPIIASVISLLMTIMGIVLALISVKKLQADGDFDINGVKVNGLDFTGLVQSMDADDLREIGSGLDLFVLMSSTWPLLVLAFVVFFYCLGALYDDRKDRSVLFWKSMPISDSHTVLSKVTSALVTAPVIALLVCAATVVATMLILSVVVLVSGNNPMTVVWGPASPMRVMGYLIAAMPMYVLWALPTVGWLLLCSAWARSKPFLWAVMLPVFAGVIVSWLSLFSSETQDSSWFWSNVVGRLLLGTVPGIDVVYRGIGQPGNSLESVMRQFASVDSLLATLATPSLWIGAAAGIAMIFAAIRLRRWRDEG